MMEEVPDGEIEVRAGGGVVRRRGPGDVWEVALVHRPRDGDWSLPKGKVEPGESVEEAALREVEEETGLVCRLLHPCGQSTYRDRKGRLKRVWYWVMEVVVSGTFTPSKEVEEVRWEPVSEAIGRLTYPLDRELLAAAPLDS